MHENAIWSNFIVVHMPVICWKCEDYQQGFELVPLNRYGADLEHICGVCRNWMGHDRPQKTAGKVLLAKMEDSALGFGQFVSQYAYNDEGRLSWIKDLTLRPGRGR